MARRKVINDKKHIIFVSLASILVAMFFLGIGYAQIANITLDVNGVASLDSQTGIVISDIHYTNSNNANEDHININTYYQNMFSSNVTLGNNQNAFVTLSVTIKNLTNEKYVFDSYFYDTSGGQLYSNLNIVPSLSGITENVTILDEKNGTNDEITFSLTFSYLDANNITNSILNGVVSFHFTPVVSITYDGLTNASGNSQEYIRSEAYTTMNSTTYNPSVNLGSYSGGIEIKNSAGTVTLVENTDYTYSNGIVTFLNDLTEDYVIHKVTNGTKATEYIKAIVEDVTPDSNDVYTATPVTGCTNTFVYDGTSDNNLRYVGISPCNYVHFNCDSDGNNCETWRIIGVMSDVTGKENVKILKDTLDHPGTRWNSTASNNWEQSELYNTLNTTYYSGLNNDFGKNLIESVYWPIGGSSANLNSPNFYTAEHTTMSSAKFNVGLFSPSDYGYATSGGTNRANCISALLSNGTGYASGNCRSNNWLYNNSSSFQWTMIARPTSANNNAFVIQNAGLVTYATVTSNGTYYNYRPCVYLKNEVLITDGDGSSTHPYELG